MGLFTRKKTLTERIKDGVTKGDFSETKFDPERAASLGAAALVGVAAATNALSEISDAWAHLQSDAARNKK